jgi:flagellar hook-associated protein 2
MAIEAAGAPRITFGGLASGLDSSAIIDALLRVERQPILRLQSQQAEVRQQQELLRKFNSLLLALRDAARAIDNRSDTLTAPAVGEELLAMRAVSSNEDRLGVVATPSAAPGTYDVRVERLASAARVVSAAFTAETDVVAGAGDTLQIDFGGDAPIVLSFTGDTTLAELADRIEAAPENQGAVRAHLIDDGLGSVRLVLVGAQAGADHDVVVSGTLAGPGGTDFVDAALSQPAQNAQLRVLGIPIERSSNEISDALPGVTLSLRGVNDPDDPSDAFQVTVTRDDEAIVERLQAFVDAYNEVRRFVNEQSAVDATGRGGPLSADFTLRSVDRVLRSALQGTRAYPGNPFGYLGAIGISFDRQGALALDREALVEALGEDPDAVRELLSGDGVEDGIATALARALDELLRTGEGAVDRRLASLADRVGDIQDAIDRLELRLAQREEDLVRQFTALESLLATLQNSASFLQNIQQLQIQGRRRSG